MTGIIGKKLGMTQIFGDDGRVAAVTAIEAGPCTVTQVKTTAKDGYNAIQLGFGEVKQPKSQAKQAKRFRHLREFMLDASESAETEQKIDVSQFKVGDLVDITGVSKGKGFAGVVKRYHFAGGPKTHGQSDRHRARGSVGASASPGRVLKGLRMAGQMGNKQVTARHLEILQADLERNLLVVKGAVPGGRNGLLLVKKASRGK
ncbi:50S ribosomal protein L3 [Chloroflexota bacterium]